jgi:SAM-dependent methyltransferase
MNGKWHDVGYLSSIAGSAPWWAKIAGKLVLSRLPVEHALWKRLGLFQYGAMEQPAYAYSVFKKHFDRVRGIKTLDRFVCMELGPGDSLLSAVVAHAFGASSSYLMDVGAFAQADLKPYRAMADLLKKMGLPAPEMDSIRSLDAVLVACGATYGTSGLESLRAIPDSSVDFVWSHAVLEHLRQKDFLETMRQLRRVLRDNGVCSHVVDLRDHLGGGLNHLRFSDGVWESRFMAESGFYTNRILYSEMMALFRQAGFAVDVLEVNHWDRLPTPRPKLCGHFQRLSEDELCISGFEVILRPV